MAGEPRGTRVSIPFKRERGSQVYWINPSYSLEKHIKFLFPSNGKGDRKFVVAIVVAMVRYFVSIPFKRERVSQAQPELIIDFRISKVSIPFKRESGSQA